MPTGRRGAHNARSKQKAPDTQVKRYTPEEKQLHGVEANASAPEDVDITADIAEAVNAIESVLVDTPKACSADALAEEVDTPKACSADAPAEEVLRAADLIKEADVLLVIAGAGMGVDSGLDKFRGPDGSYTMSDYQEKCQHALFVKDPQAAWAFHGPVLGRFRETQPHEGFEHLLSICRSKASYYVVTSNVDEQFQKAGFEATRVFNAHGSVHLWQCMRGECNKGRDPWAAGTWSPGQLPQCKFCKSLARPCVSLFDDNLEPYPDSFNTRILERQFALFENWLMQMKFRRICIIEIGCGISEHSLRLIPKPKSRWACMSDEWGLAPLCGSLVRIDPEPTSPAPDRQRFVQISAGAADSLRQLRSVLPCQPSGPSRNLQQSGRKVPKQSGRKAARKQ